MIINVAIILGLVLFQYALHDPTVVKPHRFFVPTQTASDSKGSYSSDSIWNMGAILRQGLDDQLAKRDHLERVKEISNPANYPTTLRIHLADSFPTNLTWMKAGYEVFLFISGAWVLRKYVVPYFDSN